MLRTNLLASTLRALGTIRYRGLFATLMGLIVIAGAMACGDDDSDSQTDTGEPATQQTEAATATQNDPTATVGPGTRTVQHALGETEIPAEPQRIVALGEEFMLADLLDLAVQPIASTASGTGATFIGLDGYDLNGIQPLSNSEPDLEGLVALQPDLIITWDLTIESVGGIEILSQVAPTVAIAIQPDFKQTYRDLAAVFAKEAQAEARIAEYEDAAMAAGGSLDAANRTVSVATVYPGASITVYVDGAIDLPQALLDMGFSLVPGAEVFPPTRSNGRAELSLEQVDVLAGEDIVMLQSSAIDGEDEALAQVTASAAWQLLPAVEGGRVHTVDRFGHLGLAGRIALIGELESMLDR